MKLNFVITLLLLFPPLIAFGDGPPHVSGYGVKSCLAFSQTADGMEQGDGSAMTPYLRYREWLAGLATGLTLATGEDVLHGLEFDQAMERIALFCEGHPSEDFFTGAMDLLKGLSGPK
ncbi:MAG: hypothetical protein RPU39_13065 [Candidatus Sedimenticola sp. (ex Thyasira tokunagai)]